MNNLERAQERRKVLFAQALDVIGRPSSVIPMSPRFLEWALEEEVGRPLTGQPAATPDGAQPPAASSCSHGIGRRGAGE